MRYVESPLNYIGSKFTLLRQIIPLFPANINTFVDLFNGGCNMGINVNANKIIFNDNDPHLNSIHETFKNQPLSTTLQQINSIIRKHNLSKNNKASYLKFREYVNSKDVKEPMEILTIIFYAYNNQIRYNKRGNFMNSSGCGRSSFNDSIREKLRRFVLKLQNTNCEFLNKNFREFDFSNLSEDDFVYADPPYLLADTDYSRREGWNETIEKELYKTLLDLHSKGIKWALSNVLEHKGKTHHLLYDFCKENNFNMIFLNKQYDNANYNAIKISNSKEVLIVNYPVKKRNGLFSK